MREVEILIVISIMGMTGMASMTAMTGMTGITGTSKEYNFPCERFTQGPYLTRTCR